MIALDVVAAPPDRHVERLDSRPGLTGTGEQLAAHRREPVAVWQRAVEVVERPQTRSGAVPLGQCDRRRQPHGHRLPAVRGELLARAGDVRAAVEALDVAIERCGNDVEREHLTRRRDELASRRE